VNGFSFDRFRPEEEKEGQQADHSRRHKEVKVFSASLSLFPASSLPGRSHFEIHSIQTDDFSQWNRSEKCGIRNGECEMI
jgi:hypothetical protein